MVGLVRTSERSLPGLALLGAWLPLILRCARVLLRERLTLDADGCGEVAEAGCDVGAGNGGDDGEVPSLGINVGCASPVPVS